MPPRRKRKLNGPSARHPEIHVEDEEVVSVHTISDDSPPPPPAHPPKSKRAKGLVAPAQSISDESDNDNTSRTRGIKARKEGVPIRATNGRQTRSSQRDLHVVTISDGEAEIGPASQEVELDDEGIKLEEVDIPPSNFEQPHVEEEMDFELEEVDVEADHSNAYAAAYEAVAAQQGTDEEGGEGSNQIVFKDGKGQLAGFSISLSTPAKKAALAAKRAAITTKDRQTRLAVHKWMVLCLIAHAKQQNRLLNDEDLRDYLYSLVPNNYLEKLRVIHPKKVPLQNERVRQFEAFLRDITRWWSFKFHLEPNLTTSGALRQPDSDLYSTAPGKRVDGWIVETAKERDDRHRLERRAQKEKEQEMKQEQSKTSKKRKGKGKAKEAATTETEASPSKIEDRKAFLSEITLFKSETSTTLVYLRLANSFRGIETSKDLEDQVEKMSGSRETKAQLFVSLCRALGIPARLVISIQAPSWSVAASKVAATIGPTRNDSKNSKVLQRKRAMKEGQGKRRQTAHRPDDLMTSEDDGFLSSFSVASAVEQQQGSARSKSRRSNGTASRPMSVASTASIKSAAGKSVTMEEEDTGAETKTAVQKKAKEEEQDYRDEKWKNLEAPLQVKYEPKLRIQKPKALRPGEIAADSLSDVEPVDISAPPTMWAEVFSKPWQRWITVDPVRGMVEPMGNRHMEPSSSDKSNRLVYVVAFEEDGYARDVTARYTKTLHSRVSRMRPPPIKVGGQSMDWWANVVKAFHRPQQLERDAVEDIELEGSAAKEPMPSSVAAFKEHPVYTLEKHLKRDEVIFPARQAGTFQGLPVFLQANVVACRSARQWYNQGRVVKAGEEALKWVKSRGYTIANKRAEEEARLQGQEGLQEGLYALFQTELYRPPPVVDGRVPTNSFGNIDLFVDTMLPEGAAHVPYTGAVRVAKKLGIHYAEAIVSVSFEKCCER